MPDPRRHHLLPQFYMRLFADAKERIVVIPGVDVPGPAGGFTSGITNVLVERDYYKLVDSAGVEHFFVEEAYAEIESRAKDSMDVLLSEGLACVTDERRSAFSEFMAVQVTRGRQHRAMVKKASAQLAEMTVKTAASRAPDEWFERMAAEAEASGEEPVLPMTPAMRERWLSNDMGFDIVPTQEHVIELSFVALEQLTFMFLNMSWKLLRFEQPWLITCDHPVSYWRRPTPMDAFYGIGPATADEVRLPLSPNAALVLVHPHRVDQPGDAEHDVGVQAARCLNRDLIAWSAGGTRLSTPNAGGRAVPLVPNHVRRDWVRPWGPYR